ncbi:hypothetical protein [Streptomyces antibioticus]|uniref:hypothetical protein n=1 Tax=Streptomyces antibioticus TaxID=1890 RepID=UPI0033B61AD3
MPGFGMLIDAFDGGALDPDVWSQSYGDPTVEGGRLRVPCTTGYAGARTGSAYTLWWSQVAARVYPPAAGGGSSAGCSLLVLSGVGGRDVGFFVDQAQGAMGLYLREGYADGGALFPAYDPVAHAWLRLREDGGDLFWEAGPDGRTWTVLRTAPSPLWVAHEDLSLLFEAHRDAGAADFAELDGLNVARAGAVGPGARRLAGPGPGGRAASTVRGG